MRLNIIVLVLLGVVSADCVTHRRIQPTIMFRPDEAAHVFNAGASEITGQAFIRQRGGGIVTCAGYEVRLVPLSKYAVEAFKATYGEVLTDIVIFRSFDWAGNLPGFEHPLEYSRYQRVSTCDAEGRFTFNGVPKGAYFVESIIRWDIPGQYIDNIQGGGLATQLYVDGIHNQDLILTP